MRHEPRHRKGHYVLALIAIILFVAYLEKHDVSQAVIEERREAILSHPLGCCYATMRTCVADKCDKWQHAKGGLQ